MNGRADFAAARAVRAWLLAVGLAAEIDALREPGDAGLTPAPGLHDLTDRIEAASRSACEGADLAARLAEEHAFDPSAIDSVVDAAATGERDLRRLAQLALGVSAHCAAGDRVERLDRAAVAILAPPEGQGPSAPLVDDALKFYAQTPSEAVTEIAGLVCRLLLEEGTVARVRPVGNHLVIDFSVEAGTLRMTTDGGSESTWDSPVTANEPARAAVERWRKEDLRGDFHLVGAVEAHGRRATGVPPS